MPESVHCPTCHQPADAAPLLVTVRAVSRTDNQAPTSVTVTTGEPLADDWASAPSGDPIWNPPWLLAIAPWIVVVAGLVIAWVAR